MFDIGVQVKDTVCLFDMRLFSNEEGKMLPCIIWFCCTSIAYYIKMGDASSVYLHLHLHLVILQMLLSKATYNWGIHKAIILRGKQTEEVLVIPSFRHCSNKYKLEREGINKEKDKVFLYTVYTVYINLGWSQVFRMKSAFRLGVGRSFHQPGTVNVNVLNSDFEPLCDGTTRRRSLADLRLLEGM